MLNYNNWSKKLAIKIAYNEGIIMNNSHWKIIYYFRFYYFKKKSIPSVISLMNFLNKKSNNKYNSVYLFKLFPKGLIKQVTKISCLSKYISCF